MNQTVTCNTMAVVLLSQEHVFPKFLTWLITYFHHNCSSPMERDHKSVWPVRSNAKEHTHSTKCIIDLWKNITKLQQLWRGIWNIFLSTFTCREKAHWKMFKIPLQIHMAWKSGLPLKGPPSPSKIRKFLSDSFACESVVLWHHAHLHISHSPFQLEDSLDYCLKRIVVFGLWHQPTSLSLSIQPRCNQPTGTSWKTHLSRKKVQ